MIILLLLRYLVKIISQLLFDHDALVFGYLKSFIVPITWLNYAGVNDETSYLRADFIPTKVQNISSHRVICI